MAICSRSGGPGEMNVFRFGDAGHPSIWRLSSCPIKLLQEKNIGHPGGGEATI